MFIIINSGVDHLRDVFGRMGLNDKDIVALSGGHTLVCMLHPETKTYVLFSVLAHTILLLSGSVPQGAFRIRGCMDTKPAHF